MNNILITGVGSYLPKKTLSNNELPDELDTSDEWIKKRTGIKQRHLVSEGELTSSMAVAAAKQALLKAKIDSKETQPLTGPDASKSEKEDNKIKEKTES